MAPQAHIHYVLNYKVQFKRVGTANGTLAVAAATFSAKLANTTIYTIAVRPPTRPDIHRGALFMVFAPGKHHSPVAELYGVAMLNAFMSETFRSFGAMTRATVRFPRIPMVYTIYDDPLDIIPNKNRAAADMAIQQFVRDMYTQ
jgi:hypothetical protein